MSDPKAEIERLRRLVEAVEPLVDAVYDFFHNPGCSGWHYIQRMKEALDELERVDRGSDE